LIGQVVAWYDSFFLPWYVGNNFFHAVCSFYKVK
jgi:hypothetical protein